MGQSEKSYSRVEEAEKLVADLCERYPDALWAVNPKIVTVLGIDNKKRGKKNKTLAKIIPIHGAEKAVMMLNNVDIRYIIEVYWSDYNEWTPKLKQWIIFHELQHIAADVGKTVKHDCEDFRIVLDIVGVNWTSKESELPDLINGDKVEFDLNLRPNMVDYCEDNDVSTGTDDDD